MKIELKVPPMGESISEATIGTFIKPSGSLVQKDEELIELETDKVNQVLYAPERGMVNWIVNLQDTVKIDQLLGTIDTEKESAVLEQQNLKQPQSSEQLEKGAAKTEEPIQPESPSLSPSIDSETPIEIESPTPSLPALPEPELPEKEPKTTEGEKRETRKKISKIRKIISERLVTALKQTAMLTTFNEVDMSAVIALRESYKEAFVKRYHVRLGYMPFFIKAAVSALKAFPQINTYIEGEESVSRHYYDICVAIGTDRGVVAPVIRNCDHLSFSEIERSIEEFSKKAREGGMMPNELYGGGFTITNGGIYGSLLSTPILNPPQCAILGMHKIMKRAVVVDDEIVIREMMYLALTYDHRLVDGKDAVSFLVQIKNCLEEPSRILIEI